MEEAVELSDYLPLSFTSPKEQEYVAFLWAAFETNYTHYKLFPAGTQHTARPLPLRTGSPYRYSRNLSMVRPVSFAIRRNRSGEMSRPEWKGTVVPLPSG